MADNGIGSFAPTNYIEQVQSPFQAALQGYSAGAGIRNDQLLQQQQQAALQQQQQQQKVVQALISNPNPTADDYAHATLLVPGLKDQFNQSWGMLNTEQQENHLSSASQVYAALVNKQPQLAAQTLQNQSDLIVKRMGGQTPQSQALATQAQAILLHPDVARTQIGMMISALPGGDKVISGLNTTNADQRAQDLHPDAIAEADAKAQTATSDAAVAAGTVGSRIVKSKADANLAATKSGVAAASMQDDIARPGLENANLRSQISNRAGQLALDQDKLQSDIDAKVAELRRKPGAIDLPASAETIINNAAVNSQVARQSSAQLYDLADQFEKADPRSLAAGTGEALAQFTGQQDYVTALRKEYTRLRATQVNSLLPPGPASDKDIENAMAGFPGPTANSQQLVSFMRGMAKLQDYSAQVEDAKSEWANQVGTLGKPSRDIEVGGVRVPAGATFSDFMRKTLKPVGAVTQPPASNPAAASVKSRLLKTYGNGVNSGQD